MIILCGQCGDLSIRQRIESKKGFAEARKKSQSVTSNYRLVGGTVFWRTAAIGIENLQQCIFEINDNFLMIGLTRTEVAKFLLDRIAQERISGASEIVGC